MHLGHRLVVKQHAGATEHSLYHDQEHRRRGQCADRGAQATPPDNTRQQQRDHANQRAQQTMAVLEEQVPGTVEPFGPRKQKHVVTVGRRPVRHRHGGVERGDQRPKAKQHRCRRDEEARDRVRPVEGAACHVGMEPDGCLS